MYAVLGTVIVLGHAGTPSRGAMLQFLGEYNYREGVSVWFRSIFLHCRPKPELMAGAPLGFQLHALLAFLLFALWPFTRLVHVSRCSYRVPHPALPRLPLQGRPTRPRLGQPVLPQRGWDKPELTQKK